MPELIHDPKGIYKRYLPHIDVAGLYQGITFRLADSLPKRFFDEWALSDHKDLNDIQRAKIEKLMNAGYGECRLRDPEVAQIVQDALLHFHEDRYTMAAWVIMPNHIHVLMKTEEGHSLPDIIKSWKGFTARKINKVLNCRGKFWADGFFDRYMRDEKHFFRSVNYIHENPVKAGLVQQAVDWEFSSAQRFDAMIQGSTDAGLHLLKES